MIYEFFWRHSQNVWRITIDEFEKKKDEIRNKQAIITGKIKDHEKADDEYYLTASYLLELAKHSAELFESSEMIEKRQIMKLAVLNPTMKAKEVHYNLIKPFDKILFYSNRRA